MEKREHWGVFGKIGIRKNWKAEVHSRRDGVLRGGCTFI